MNELAIFTQDYVVPKFSGACRSSEKSWRKKQGFFLHPTPQNAWRPLKEDTHLGVIHGLL